MCGRSEALAILSEVYHSCNETFPKRVRDAYLYGSYARNDHDAASDVDILLTVDAPVEDLPLYRKLLAKINSTISLKYDVTVSATVKSLAEFERHRSVLPYYQNVVAEGIRYAP